MEYFTVFYAVFFILVGGEPVTMVEDKWYKEVNECIVYIDEHLLAMSDYIRATPESYATGICVHKQITKEELRKAT